MSDDNKLQDSSKDSGVKVIDKRKFSEDTGENSGETAGTEPEKQDTSFESGEEDKGVAAFEPDFSTFIYSLNTQALLFLGKIPNPMTGKYEKDINTAKYLIDTIDVLSKKTKGNLDDNESKLIENILYDLRMAYISEKK